MKHIRVDYVSGRNNKSCVLRNARDRRSMSSSDFIALHTLAEWFAQIGLTFASEVPTGP